MGEEAGKSLGGKGGKSLGGKGGAAQHKGPKTGGPGGLEGLGTEGCFLRGSAEEAAHWAQKLHFPLLNPRPA